MAQTRPLVEKIENEKKITTKIKVLSFDLDNTLFNTQKYGYNFTEEFLPLLYFCQAINIPFFISTNRTISESIDKIHNEISDSLEHGTQPNFKEVTLYHGIDLLNKKYKLNPQIITALDYFDTEHKVEIDKHTHYRTILTIEEELVNELFKNNFKDYTEYKKFIDEDFKKRSQIALQIKNENELKQKALKEPGIFWKKYHFYLIQKKLLDDKHDILIDIIHVDDDPFGIIKGIATDTDLNNPEQKLHVLPIKFWEMNGSPAYTSVLEETAIQIGLKSYATQLTNQKQLTGNSLADFSALLYLLHTTPSGDATLLFILEKFKEVELLQLDSTKQDLFINFVKYWNCQRGEFSNDPNIDLQNMLKLLEDEKLQSDLVDKFYRARYSHLSEQSRLQFDSMVNYWRCKKGQFSGDIEIDYFNMERLFHSSLVSEDLISKFYHDRYDLLNQDFRQKFDRLVVSFDVNNINKKLAVRYDAKRLFRIYMQPAWRDYIYENCAKYVNSSDQLSIFNQYVANYDAREILRKANVKFNKNPANQLIQLDAKKLCSTKTAQFSGHSVRDFHAIRYLVETNNKKFTNEHLIQFYKNSYPHLSEKDKRICNNYISDKFKHQPEVYKKVFTIAKNQPLKQQPWTDVFSQKWEELSSGWKIAAGITIGVSLALAIPAAVFFSPYILGSFIALAGLSAIAHVIHIQSKEIPYKNDPEKLIYPQVKPDQITPGPREIIDMDVLKQSSANPCEEFCSSPDQTTSIILDKLQGTSKTSQMVKSSPTVVVEAKKTNTTDQITPQKQTQESDDIGYSMGFM